MTRQLPHRSRTSRIRPPHRDGCRTSIPLAMGRVAGERIERCSVLLGMQPAFHVRLEHYAHHIARATFELQIVCVIVDMFSGQPTRAALGSRMLVVAQDYGHDNWSWCLDYTGTAKVLDGAYFKAVLRGEGCRITLGMRGAMTVRPEQLALFVSHSERMVEQSIARGLFTNHASALSRAQELARVVFR